MIFKRPVHSQETLTTRMKTPSLYTFIKDLYQRYLKA